MKTLVLSVFLSLLLTLSPDSAGEISMHAKDTISVSGTGEVSAEPDQAIVSLTVSATDLNVNKAKLDADKKYQAVLDAAKNQGVKKADIKISSINLNPEYQWRDNSQILIGTRVSRSLSITLNEIEGVAPLLQELVEGGVSNIDQVQTGFQNRSELERKALVAAISDAKEKAEFLAEQFDKQLGSAYTITENNRSQPMFRSHSEGMMQAKTMSAELPQERFGTLKVTASVSVVFHAQ